MTRNAHGRGLRGASPATPRAALAALVLMASCAGLASRVLPPSVTGKPYLKLYENVRGFAVWIVDGQYVRENLDEEFTNFGQHLNFRFIPAREFWLDVENTPGEAPFFIAHLLEENRLMARGTSYDDALVKADETEAAERLKARLGQEGKTLRESGQSADLITQVHKELLTEYSGNLGVWLVDGEAVRDNFFIDFTEGGHDKVYAFIPAREVWIDDDLKPGERKFILLHELHERALMLRGWTYPEAHKDSSRVEFHFRRQPEGLDAALRQEIAKNRS